MPPVARVGDPGSHGGVIATGSPSQTAEGRQVARIGDVYNCAVHGPNPIVEGSTIGMVDGRAIARVGDRAECGAVIAAGSLSMSDEG